MAFIAQSVTFIFIFVTISKSDSPPRLAQHFFITFVSRSPVLFLFFFFSILKLITLFTICQCIYLFIYLLSYFLLGLFEWSDDVSHGTSLWRGLRFDFVCEQRALWPGHLQHGWHGRRHWRYVAVLSAYVFHESGQRRIRSAHSDCHFFR